jgi:hypothetical protein
LRAKVPTDSSRLERGCAIALRSFVLLLVAYIVFHKAFPFAVLDRRLGELTVGEFLLAMVRTISATAAPAYLVFKAFRTPDLPERDRIWCERWSGLAFGAIAVLTGSILVFLLESKGIVMPIAHAIAARILWLLF